MVRLIMWSDHLKTGQSVQKFQMVTVFYLSRSNWTADAVVDLSLVLDGHNILIAWKQKTNFLDEYSGDLKLGLVWIFNVQKEVGLQMVWISMGSEIRKLNYLKSGHMAASLSKPIWNPYKNVRILNGRDYS